MSPNQLRESIRHQPFRPFLILTEDGRNLPVEHPEFIAVSPSGREVTFYTSDNSQHWLDARLIRELIILPPAEPAEADLGEDDAP